MNGLDYLIVFCYIAAFLYLGVLFSSQESKSDYYLGGKSFNWFPLSLSVMATQLSAISFISAPAFVGIREGGGFQWLSYELGVPLAMIFLATYLVPKLYNAGIISIYEYLERRFDRSTRVLISLVFQVSRAFGTGVMIYAVALILMSVLGIPLWQTIVLIGVITVIYSYQGGMKAVVYGDMIQMIILMIGIVICCTAGLYYLGGWANFTQELDRDRLEVLNFSSLGIQGDGDFGFFPMLIGGFFLYASYYGTDQSQVQRLLSARDLKTVRNTLLFNGLLRFPITFLYCLMGLIIGTFAHQEAALMALIPADKPDLLIPIFIRDYLPHGVIGLLIVAILSAAMSSLSSAVNSLSAVSTEDILVRGRELDNKTYVRYSRYTTVFWGFVCIGLAFFAGDIADTVIEAINKIGSVFYGPILATFLVAARLKHIGARAMNIGLLLGVGFNCYLWLGLGDQVFWFWWNFIGAFTSMSVAILAQMMMSTNTKVDPEEAQEVEEVPRLWTRENLILLAYFFFIILISLLIPYFL